MHSQAKQKSFMKDRDFNFGERFAVNEPGPRTSLGAGFANTDNRPGQLRQKAKKKFKTY